VVLGVVEKGGEVGADDIATKLLNFGADGVTSFQDARMAVTKQLQTKNVPFIVGIHCFAHCVNLVARTLSSNSIF
jgi:hypothetical protein